MKTNMMNLSISDYPELASMRTGREIKMEVTVKLGAKQLAAGQESIDCQVLGCEVKESKRQSVREILLDIANKDGQSTVV